VFQVDENYPGEIRITLCGDCFENTYPVIDSSASEDSDASDADGEASSSEESESGISSEDNPER